MLHWQLLFFYFYFFQLKSIINLFSLSCSNTSFKVMPSFKVMLVLKSCLDLRIVLFGFVYCQYSHAFFLHLFKSFFSMMFLPIVTRVKHPFTAILALGLDLTSHRWRSTSIIEAPKSRTGSPVRHSHLFPLSYCYDLDQKQLMELLVQE